MGSLGLGFRAWVAEREPLKTNSFEQVVSHGGEVWLREHRLVLHAEHVVAMSERCVPSSLQSSGFPGSFLNGKSGQSTLSY